MYHSPPVWDGVLRQLGTEIPDFALSAWLRPLVVHERGSTLRLGAPNAFHRERVRSRFLERIRRCAAELAGRSMEVVIEVTSEASAAAGSAPVGPAPQEERPLRPTPRRRSVGPAPPSPPRQPSLPHTFETFVVGSTNALAREASLALAQGRQPSLSPLYLVGPSGSGKSHLARALVTEARRHGAPRCLYCSAESFTSELTSSIRSRETARFKRRFREQCDLLVLEDIQFLEGKNATQLELFHTLEHLRRQGARLVLTGDRLPRELSKLDRRLASQMASGLVAELELPGLALRREILRDRASRGGVRLPPDCLDFLAEAVRGSVQDLEGVLIQLVASASLLGRPIDRELAEAALRKVVPEGNGPLRAEEVIDCVSSFFGVSRSQLASRSRRRDVLVPRQLAMYLSRRYTDATLSEIGRALGRDHPAVANAVRVVERAILERAPLRYQVEELASRLERRRA